MTRPADGDMRRDDDAPNEVPELAPELARSVRAVRGASGPALDDGAAQRIADGAWLRAQGRSQKRTVRSSLRRLSPIVRRWSIAAAVLVTAGIVAFAIRPTEPAFAIDGDPVQVLSGDRWVNESRRVRPGATVFVADGATVLRGPGAEIAPQPGATFRIVGEAGERFRVEILGGAAEVTGDSVHLAFADVDVEPTPQTGIVCMFASVPPVVEGLPTPRLDATSTRLSDARVEIRLGAARLLRASTGETLELSSTDRAAFLPVSADARGTFRLGRLRAYSPSVAMKIATGHPLIEMRRSGTETIAVLGGPDESVMGFTIEGHELPLALDDMHSAMVSLVTQLDALDLRVRIAAERLAWDGGADPIEAVAARSRQRITELVHTVHDVEHRVIVSQDGTVVVEHVGESSETYPSIDAALESDPEAVAPLRTFLEDR